METDSLFWVALQGSLVLGLVHGVNPCSHGWLVLAPFVVGEKRGAKAAWLTFSFLTGTAIACLLLGLTLGAVSALIPPSVQFWVETGTSVILVALGVMLIINPGLIHHHHSQDQISLCINPKESPKKLTGLALFSIGFVNMIVPCPTVAMMYKYALSSSSAGKASFIFGAYALSTAVAVGGVIYALFHVARLLKKISQDGVERVLMRGAGVVTLLFAGFSLFTHLS